MHAGRRRWREATGVQAGAAEENSASRVVRQLHGRRCCRVVRGERDSYGKPVAELRPIGVGGVPAADLVLRRANLPLMDSKELREDLDAVIDRSL